MHVALYHEAAGSRHAGGIAVFVREVAVALAPDHEVTLLTGPGKPPARLRESSVRVVALPAWPSAGGIALPAWTPTGGSVLPGWPSADDGGVLPGDDSPSGDDGTVLPADPTALATRLPGVTEQVAEKLRRFAGGLRAGAFRRVAAEADLVWTHQFLDDLLVSQVASPTVYQYHGVRSVGRGARARELLSRTGVHLANAAPTAEAVRERLGREVDGVLRPGVALDRFRPDVAPAFDADAPVVLYVGRLTEGKGAFDLLDAVARVEDLRCRFVGRGEEEPLRARARDRGVADRVTFAGSVPHADLPGHFAAADLACVPAHYESFGMANLEAMACGTPVVATEGCRAPAVRETAALVPAGDPRALADELAALLDAPERRAELSERGRETARRHSWDRRAEEFVELCEPIIG